jgi:hypothetical protein
MLNVGNPTSAISQMAEYNAERGRTNPNIIDQIDAFTHLNPLTAPLIQGGEQMKEGTKQVVNALRNDQPRVEHLTNDIADRYDEQIYLGKAHGYTPEQISELERDKQLAVQEIQKNPNQYTNVFNRLTSIASGLAKTGMGVLSATPEGQLFGAGINTIEGAGNTFKTDIPDKVVQAIMSPASSTARALGYNGTENDTRTHLLELADLGSMLGLHSSLIKGKN